MVLIFDMKNKDDIKGIFYALALVLGIAALSFLMIKVIFWAGGDIKKQHTDCCGIQELYKTPNL